MAVDGGTVPAGIRIESLESVPESVLCEAFNEAFSDYRVPVRLDVEAFRTMHRRRGVDYAASLGAFAEADASTGGDLVGVLFNGLGTWRGASWAYDAGTGIVPSHRGMGLSGALARCGLEHLKALGCRGWLLEVIVGNDRALQTYRKAGFVETRRLACPRGTIPEASERAESARRTAGIVVRELSAFDVPAIAPFRDWEPSWQNSDDSIRRTPEPLLVLGAYGEEERAGMGLLGYLVSTAQGSIFQCAVARGARRRGIGGVLLLALGSRVPGGAVQYINVLRDDRATLGLLAKYGIRHEIEQWEMERILA